MTRPLPKGWQVRALGDVADTALGKMLDRGRPRGGQQVPYLRNANVQWGGISTADVQYMELGDSDRARFSLEPGDLLVCEGGEIGRAAIWQGSQGFMSYQKALHRVRVGPEILTLYVRYLLEHYSYTGVLAAQATGSTIPHLPQQQLRRLPVPLPSVREQKRIVETLEAHLSRLDAAAVDLARVDQGTRALELASVSALMRDARTVRLPLAELLDLSIGGVWGAAPGEDECDVDVLRVTELRPRGRLDSTTSARRSVSQKVLASRQLEPGDLLLEKSGGGPKQPVGRVGLVGELRGPSVCSNFMQLMRPRRSLVEPGFLHLYLNALHQSGGTSHMQRASTNIRNIKASEYMALEVPVPDLAAQRSGLATARAAATEVDRLRAATGDTQRRSSALRKALLATAFSGRLTSPLATRDIEEMADV